MDKLTISGDNFKPASHLVSLSLSRHLEAIGQSVLVPLIASQRGGFLNDLGWSEELAKSFLFELFGSLLPW